MYDDVNGCTEYTYTCTLLNPFDSLINSYTFLEKLTSSKGLHIVLPEILNFLEKSISICSASFFSRSLGLIGWGTLFFSLTSSADSFITVDLFIFVAINFRGLLKTCIFVNI